MDPAGLESDRGSTTLEHRTRSRSPRGRVAAVDPPQRAVTDVQCTDISDGPSRTADLADGSPSSGESAASLVARAIACMEELPPTPTEAGKFFEMALAVEPQSVAVLDAYGAFLCEEGLDHSRAVEVLRRSVALRPDQGAEKFFYLGQLTSGEESLAEYERGITVLKAPGAHAASGNQIASAYASIAELFMTDLCDAEDAEERCEAALACGLQADARCLQVTIAKATLRKVQGRLDEARELSVGCAYRVKAAGELSSRLFTEPRMENTQTKVPECETADQGANAVAKDSRPGAPEDAERDAPSKASNERSDVAEVEELGDEMMFTLCRTLVDLNATSEAKSLLEMMVARDDQEITAWYLLACCHLVEKDAPRVIASAQEALRLCTILRCTRQWRPALRDLLKQARNLPTEETAEE
mmetsp:Transcript_56368/g.150748  ORF Transcript_56368/g.150748 Transcript_56368/m.150748 type:complete len:415 (-) Transcript_56368:38-1282(-)